MYAHYGSFPSRTHLSGPHPCVSLPCLRVCPPWLSVPSVYVHPPSKFLYNMGGTGAVLDKMGQCIHSYGTLFHHWFGILFLPLFRTKYCSIIQNEMHVPLPPPSAESQHPEAWSASTYGHLDKRHTFMLLLITSLMPL